MSRLWMILAALLLTLGVAEAKPSFTVQGHLGFNGEGESDTVDGKDDLESDFGIMGSVEFPLSRAFRLGGRLAYSSADGDDTKATYSMADVGLWGRFVFLPGKFEAFAVFGGGLSWVTAEPDGTADDLTGQGFHLLLGPGVSYPVSRSMRVIGGLYYSYHSVKELESDQVKLEDATLTRFLLTGGVMF